MQESFFQHAIELAKKAQKQGEVPIGAVIVYQNEIIAEAFNEPITLCDPTAHAEINVIRNAAKKLNNYRLVDCDLYVTLEPCAMCAAAMIHARIKNCYFGAADPKSAANIIFNSELSEKLNHRVTVQGGILADECSNLLKDFFKNRR